MNWMVRVIGGVQPDAETLAKAPIEFGAAEVIVGSAEGPQYPLVYNPVVLQTMSPGSLSMWPADYEGENVHAIHVMENVWHVFFAPGEIEVEGMECREDGTLVHSRWEASPVGPTPKQEALLRQVFGE